MEQNGIDMNKFKLYIARDEGKWDEDVQKAGELNLFYDTPQLLFDVKDWTSYWGNARKIAQIPPTCIQKSKTGSVMFSTILNYIKVFNP